MDPELLIALDRRHVWHPYTQEATAPLPVPVVSGRGAWLTGADGRQYLDLIASWWVITHGHAHPRVARAIARQAETLEQVIFAGFTHEPAVTLARELTALLPPGLGRLFFSDNGSTAVEVALKIACQYALNRGAPRTRFLAFEGGYHGDTFGAMAAGRSSGFFRAFESLMFAVDTLPFPATWEGDEAVGRREAESLVILDAHLERHGEHYAALLVEPLIQGAGGMRFCRPEFLAALAERLRSRDILLIFDEVMTGFGRTGAMFACDKAGVVPDLIALSKGLTAGFLPMAVTVCQERIYEAFLGEEFALALAHGHSFTANLLGCAAAVASLELFAEEGTLARVAAIEAIHRERLRGLQGHPLLRRPRVMGAVAALDLAVADGGYSAKVGPELKRFFLERGLLIRPLGNVVYLMPPYCLEAEALHRAWDGVEAALEWVGRRRE
ncbi:MAG: adenosylmethionine--8-amino-7-oxononanoate transaminase [Magnetococcales bacterium]|nr:adenosylmethionine--8-amino-7-oxononanoate transaminase [Magnetococcales bacterium]